MLSPSFVLKPIVLKPMTIDSSIIPYLRLILPHCRPDDAHTEHEWRGLEWVDGRGHAHTRHAIEWEQPR